MAIILLSGSWTLIFLGLAMWALILGVPIAIAVWITKKLKRR